jgi:hypothetical protein
MNVINEIKTLLGMEIKLAQMKLMDGVTVLEADAFEAGNNVFIVNGMDKIPLPIGEYELEDGNVLVVEVEGVILEITEQAAEEVMPESNHPAAEATEPQVEASAEVTTPKRIVESVTKEMFFSEIEKLRAEIAELKSVKVSKEELNSNVDVQPLTHSPEVTSSVKLNKISSNRTMSTQDLVMSKLFN